MGPHPGESGPRGRASDEHHGRATTGTAAMRTARRRALVLLWIPVAAALVLRLLWPNPPQEVPTHWDPLTGPADQFSPSLAVWGLMLAVAGISALLGTFTVLAGTGPAPRRNAVIGALITSAATLTWPVLALTAAGGDRADTALGLPLALYLLAVAWGVAAYRATRALPLR